MDGPLTRTTMTQKPIGCDAVCWLAQVRFGLDGQHTGHAWRVVREVRRLPSGPLR
jgi:hypothetical protein